ncbi:MAG TPA: transaldolase family protein [Candidatus Limnocylindrales bacterium]|nr:transaldolase family protein [Candidatus Limnocylindrales bacterium]
MDVATLTPLEKTVRSTPTDLWNDSCSVPELEYAIRYGAVGATANPTIVHDVWKQDPKRWAGRVGELAVAYPAWTEVELAWAIVGEMSAEGAKLLEPVFVEQGGRKGRLSVQTNPTFWRTHDAMVEQAVGFTELAPNIIVKFPATSVGVRAMEEATYRGVSVNATVSFSVPQALASGEAIERGLKRREADGLDVDSMGPVVTVMMGRIEDWLKVLEARDGIAADPEAIPWSGVAVMKRTAEEFARRGLRAKPLGAAIRHRLHWTELVGGDVVLSFPHAWWKRFQASGIDPVPRFEEPVEPRYLDELRRRFPDFERAYEPDGMTPEEFDTFGPSVRTLRSFIASYHDLLHAVTDVVLPNPDKKA